MIVLLQNVDIVEEDDIVTFVLMAKRVNDISLESRENLAVVQVERTNHV